MVYSYVYILKTGNEKLEQFSLILMPQMKSLFIENRIKKKKKKNSIMELQNYANIYNAI